MGIGEAHKGSAVGVTLYLIYDALPNIGSFRIPYELSNQNQP